MYASTRSMLRSGENLPKIDNLYRNELNLIILITFKTFVNKTNYYDLKQENKILNFIRKNKIVTIFTTKSFDYVRVEAHFYLFLLTNIIYVKPYKDFVLEKRSCFYLI